MYLYDFLNYTILIYLYDNILYDFLCHIFIIKKEYVFHFPFAYYAILCSIFT